MKTEVAKKINHEAGLVEGCVNEYDEFITYEASAHLKEMVRLLSENIDEEKDTLSYSYEAYQFVADNYMKMGRFSVSAKYNEVVLSIAGRLFSKYGTLPEGIEDIFYKVLRDRNFYVDDDCKDLKKLVTDYSLMAIESVERIYNARMAKRRTFNNDPVEMTEAYLNVIDDVERKIANRRTIHGMGSCFEIWELKRQFLANEGISWNSPAELNPGVMFD